MNAATPLFDLIERSIDAPPDPPRFDGVTFEPEHDGERLSGQLARTFEAMRDGQWRTLAELAAIVGGSEAGVSARCRDLRKTKFGCHTVERRRRGEAARGLFEYRLIVNNDAATVAAETE
jgi:hypothetical protein